MTGAAPTRVRPEPIREAQGNPLRQAFATLTLAPVAGLLVLLVLPAPLALLGIIDYASVVPTLVFMGGIVVLFVGAWWDFGARKYVQTLMEQHLPFGEKDLEFVHRRQFHLMVLYFALGGAYILVAFAVAAVGGGLG